MKFLLVLAALLAVAAAWGPYPYPGYGYGGYRPNTASQTSNANSGNGGTSIASGTANANGYRDTRAEASTLKPVVKVSPLKAAKKVVHRAAVLKHTTVKPTTPKPKAG